MVSDKSEAVVCLDTEGIDVAAVARTLTDLLVIRNIVTADSRPDPLLHPSAWRPGPGCSSVLEPHSPGWRDRANDGVDIVTERVLHHPHGNYEPPSCARCATSYDEEAHHAAVEPWLEGTEPVLICPVCHWSAPAGDWPATGRRLAGDMAVRGGRPRGGLPQLAAADA